jgi:hypothetical protein
MRLSRPVPPDHGGRVVMIRPHAEPSDWRIRGKGVKAHSRNIYLTTPLRKRALQRAIIRDLTGNNPR